MGYAYSCLPLGFSHTIREKVRECALSNVLEETVPLLLATLVQFVSTIEDEA